MNKRLLKRIFPVIAIMLLLPWPVAYAYEASGNVAEGIQITSAGASAQPTWSAFGKAVGSVTAGDLFYIDATDNAADITVTLHLTNPAELIHNYKYLILEVGLYSQAADGNWHKVAEHNGEPVPDTFITMRSGQVSFDLPGYTSYKVTIDEGSFYCYGAGAGQGTLSPDFYLEVD